jgi:dihydrofolate reductase
MITIIAATGKNNELGKNNTLVWHLPDDFKRFKELTTGHHIIMGRKTFESFPKPLPNRTHVVITRQNNYNPDGCIVVDSMEEAIKVCPQNEEIFIIGGGEIYNLGMPFSSKIELTRVFESFDADTFFPEINFTEWKLINEEFHQKDEKHLFEFSYQTYIRN